MSIPKLLRRDFLNHRELLGKLCRAAFETAQELMAEAAGDEEGFRTAMVAAMLTSGDLMECNPHVHAIAPRGGWNRDGEWIPIHDIDTRAAGVLFRSKVVAFLKAEGLLTEQRIELLDSWQHCAPG